MPEQSPPLDSLDRGFRTAAEAARARRALSEQVSGGRLKPSAPVSTVNELLDLHLDGLDADQRLSATIVAPRAGEMVHEVVLAMRTRMFTGRLAQTVHAYPTWSTAVRQAAAQFFLEVDGRRARPARRSGTP